jgi:DNA-binding CsgD family transcriptional regulator
MSRRGVWPKTDRERVRKLMAQGLIPRQIGERLGTSEQNASRIVREIKAEPGSADLFMPDGKRKAP